MKKIILIIPSILNIAGFLLSSSEASMKEQEESFKKFVSKNFNEDKHLPKSVKKFLDNEALSEKFRVESIDRTELKPNNPLNHRYIKDYNKKPRNDAA